MNLRRVEDRIDKNTTIVFHSTSSKEELADIIIKKRFRPGSGGGKMLGPGFYANQHLYQAQKGNYGKYILKARIFGIKDFLILDKGVYEELFGKAEDNFIWQQINNKGLGELISERFIEVNGNLGSTARLASPLWDRYGQQLMRKFGGFVYTGNYDKESVVCWKPATQVQPIAWSDDKGVTWKPLKEIEQYDSGKEENLKSSELLRSFQRAKDLIQRYENYPDDKLISAIKSQLSRISEPAKLEVRTEAFRQALERLRPQTVDLL